MLQLLNVGKGFMLTFASDKCKAKRSSQFSTSCVVNQWKSLPEAIVRMKTSRIFLAVFSEELVNE